MVRGNAAYLDLPQVIRGFRITDYAAAQKTLRTRGLPASRAYYYRAIEIALLILSNRGIALQDRGADVLLETFIINFDDLFEEYLRRVLQTRAPDLLTVQDGNHEGKRPLFDDRADQSAQPDVVLTWKTSGRKAIGEIKYKEGRRARTSIRRSPTRCATALTAPC